MLAFLSCSILSTVALLARVFKVNTPCTGNIFFRELEWMLTKGPRQNLQGKGISYAPAACHQVGSSEMSVSNVITVVYSTSAHVRIRAVFGSEYGVEAPLLTFHTTW